MGGDLRHLDSPTLALLTNPEVLAVNQKSHGNMPWFVNDGMRIWTAKADNGDTYLALFNTTDKTKAVGLDLKYLGLKTVKVRDLWTRKDLSAATGRVSADLPAHGSALYRLSAA
jgi:hypothetical protein